MDSIEINDRVLVTIRDRDYPGVATSHPGIAFGRLQREVRLDEPVALDGASAARRDWLVPVGQVRLDGGALAQTFDAIKRSRLKFHTTTVAAVSANPMVKQHNERGWVLITRTGAGRGRVVLVFAAVAAVDE